MRILTVWLAIAALGLSALVQDRKGKGVQLKDLPATVQKTVKDNLKGGQIKNIGREKEDRVEQLEAETVLSGKGRDFKVDSKGPLLMAEPKQEKNTRLYAGSHVPREVFTLTYGTEMEIV